MKHLIKHLRCELPLPCWNGRAYHTKQVNLKLMAIVMRFCLNLLCIYGNDALLYDYILFFKIKLLIILEKAQLHFIKQVYSIESSCNLSLWSKFFCFRQILNEALKLIMYELTILHPMRSYNAKFATLVASKIAFPTSIIVNSDKSYYSNFCSILF